MFVYKLKPFRPTYDALIPGLLKQIRFELTAVSLVTTISNNHLDVLNVFMTKLSYNRSTRN